MKKRVKMFVCIILLMISGLTLIIPAYAITRIDHYTEIKNSYIARGYVACDPCHDGYGVINVQVRASVYPVLNPSAGTSYVYGPLVVDEYDGLSTYSNSNYVVASAMHYCKGYCEKCYGSFGNNNYHS